MPRTLLHRRYWERVNRRLKNRRVGVKASWFARWPLPQFIDYWPEVPATQPEKRIFAALIRRQINFYFSWFWGDMPFTLDKEEHFRPDFILPDYRIIIEVQGFYWHSRPGMFEYDRNKYGLYIASGWDVRLFTDIEIMQDVEAALDTIPALVYGTIHGNMHLVGDRPFQPSAAITGRMRRFPKVTGIRWKRGTRRQKGVRASWRPEKAPTIAQPPLERIFLQEDIDEVMIKAYEEVGQNWLKWLNDLKKFFEVKARRTVEEALWLEFQKWENWWDRFTLPPP